MYNALTDRQTDRDLFAPCNRRLFRCLRGIPIRRPCGVIFRSHRTGGVCCFLSATVTYWGTFFDSGYRTGLLNSGKQSRGRAVYGQHKDNE